MPETSLRFSKPPHVNPSSNNHTSSQPEASTSLPNAFSNSNTFPRPQSDALIALSTSPLDPSTASPYRPASAYLYPTAEAASLQQQRQTYQLLLPTTHAHDSTNFPLPLFYQHPYAHLHTHLTQQYNGDYIAHIGSAATDTPVTSLSNQFPFKPTSSSALPASSSSTQTQLQLINHVPTNSIPQLIQTPPKPSAIPFSSSQLSLKPEQANCDHHPQNSHQGFIAGSIQSSEPAFQTSSLNVYPQYTLDPVTMNAMLQQTHFLQQKLQTLQRPQPPHGSQPLTHSTTYPLELFQQPFWGQTMPIALSDADTLLQQQAFTNSDQTVLDHGKERSAFLKSLPRSVPNVSHFQDQTQLSTYRSDAAQSETLIWSSSSQSRSENSGTHILGSNILSASPAAQVQGLSVNEREFFSRSISGITMSMGLPRAQLDSVYRIGRYSLAERHDRIKRYRDKRAMRNYNRRVKYDCRKVIADKRVRVHGRFVRREDEIALTKCTPNSQETNDRQCVDDKGEESTYNTSSEPSNDALLTSGHSHIYDQSVTPDDDDIQTVHRPREAFSMESG